MMGETFCDDCYDCCWKCCPSWYKISLCVVLWCCAILLGIAALIVALVLHFKDPKAA